MAVDDQKLLTEVQEFALGHFRLQRGRYELFIAAIDFDGKQMRTDIAARAVSSVARQT